VSRSLAACEGALLLIDASQGVQAQTLANYYTAADADLDIIPVLSKIDLPHADIKSVGEQIQVAFDMDPSTALPISSKTGLGIDAVFQALIDRIKPPPPLPAGVDPLSIPLRALVFDSWFDIHRGVICLVKIAGGSLRKGDKIAAYYGDETYDVQDVGLMMGKGMREVEALHTGQVGYLIAGVKNAKDVRLGETFYKVGTRKGLNRTQVQTSNGTAENHAIANLAVGGKASVEPLPGFKPARSMVFAGLFPAGEADFEGLKTALEKLCLNDASVQVEKESSQALGLGFRCGFLGVLHMDVFSSRLETDFGAPVIITAPTVPYEAVLKDGTKLKVDSPSKFPEEYGVDHYLEPFVKATIIAPTTYLGDLVDLCNTHRGTLEEMVHLTSTRISLRYRLPLSEIVVDFYDRIKTISSGYASFDYEECGYEVADIVKLDLRLNGEPVDALCVICDRSKAEGRARKLTAKLKEKIERQNFEVIIQAAIGSKVLARERIAPYRKDVLIKSGKTVGGGDQSRKKKLLEKQKAGKKRMKSIGDVEVGEEVFRSILHLGPDGRRNFSTFRVMRFGMDRADSAAAAAESSSSVIAAPSDRARAGVGSS
jgi:translation elongation factor EF-4